MRLIDTIVVPHTGGEREIELLVGDLTAIPAEHAVDLLLVSAYPNSYVPTPGTLIRSLEEVGVSVQALSERKEQDLRATSRSWISRPLERPDLHVGRILCFEPHYASTDTTTMETVVADLFRGLVPLTTAAPHVRSIATPILAAGSQGQDPVSMLETTLAAAVHWMATGLPIDVLKIVVHSGSSPWLEDAAAATFARQRDRIERDRLARERLAPRDAFTPRASNTVSDPSTEYDLFISYSRRDVAQAEALLARVVGFDPDLRVFVDRQELSPGSAWQRRIFEALEVSRHVICLLSPDYLASDPCLDEFNIALLRQRDGAARLTPAYLRTASLPTYMRLLQYVDVRESDPHLLERLAHSVMTGTSITSTISEPGSAPPAPPAEADTGRLVITSAAELSHLLATLGQDDTLEVTLEASITITRRSPGPGSESSS